jgi:hypothetical protein
LQEPHDPPGAQLPRSSPSNGSFAYEQGWPDGLPIFPPTRQAVQAMIDHVGREPGEVLGTEFPVGGSPEQLAAKIHSEMVRLGKVIRDAGIK